MAPMPDTDTIDDRPAGAVADAPAPAPTGGLPTWLRRVLTTVLLVAVVALAAWGAQSASTDGEAALDPAIIGLSPIDGAQALRQTAVGADLAQGYDGRIIINGIEVPEEQMDGARDPKTVDPKDLAENGIRPNNRNRVYFKPGPGKVIEEFDQGTVTITVRYFRERQESTSRTVTWTIRVD